ncbi:hypothetical protein [Undibacterium sp. Ji49W]|uniref:hypothetical protein n=1 Tax=Undibacterium sp. Ji49W TaxID=3413040 RepID=UPI003BF3DEC3
MTQIQSTDHLAAIIRSQIDSMRKTSRPTPTSAGNSKKEISGKKNASLKHKDLGQTIVTRVSSIPREDAQRRHKAFKVFLESVLLDEFGEGLVADPRFFRMVDDIQSQMQADPELAVLIDQAVDLLLASTNK